MAEGSLNFTLVDSYKLIRVTEQVFVSRLWNWLLFKVFGRLFFFFNHFLAELFLYINCLQLLRGLWLFELFLTHLDFLHNSLIWANVFVVLFYVNGDFIERRVLLIVCVTVHPYFIDVAVKLAGCFILPWLEICFNCRYVHRLFYNVKVIQGTVQFWIDRL